MISAHSSEPRSPESIAWAYLARVAEPPCAAVIALVDDIGPVEAAAAILIFTPILLPIATTFGIDPVHFGVIMVVNLAMGMFTPPVGLNLFIASQIAGIGIPQIARAVIPFVIILLVDLTIISFLPWLSLVFTGR